MEEYTDARVPHTHTCRLCRAPHLFPKAEPFKCLQAVLQYCHAREYVHTALRCRASLRKTKVMHREMSLKKRRREEENTYREHLSMTVNLCQMNTTENTTEYSIHCVMTKKYPATCNMSWSFISRPFRHVPLTPWPLHHIIETETPILSILSPCQNPRGYGVPMDAFHTL